MKSIFKILLLSFFLQLMSLPVTAQQSNGLVQFSPSSGSLKTNEEKAVAVTLRSDNKISAFDLYFTASSLLSITGFSDHLAITSGFNPFNQREVADDPSTGHLAFVLTGPASELPSSITLYIKLKGHQSGDGKIEIDTSRSHLLDGNGNLVEFKPTGVSYNLNNQSSASTFLDLSSLPQPNYPASTAVVKLKLKLAGVDQTSHPSLLRATAVVVGRIGEGQYQTEPRQFPLTFDSDQTFSGSVAFPDFKDGNKFSIMIKADKYLLRRICNPDASEDKVGQYRCLTPNLTIRKGEENSFDFSKVSLIPGDLGSEDGIVNGYDLGVLRNNFNKKDPSALKLADLNYDGTVDSKDFEIISNLAKTTSRQSDQ